MPPSSLKVPEGGLLLEGRANADDSSSSTLPEQAFALALSDSVIEEMINCVNNGQDIQLSLGSSPSFHLGNTVRRIPAISDSFHYDLFLTQPFYSTTKAQKIPNTMSLFKKPLPRNFPKPAPGNVRIEKRGIRKGENILKPQPEKTAKPVKSAKPAKTNKSGTSSGLDSDIEALQNSLAQHEAARTQALVIDGLPASARSAKTKSNSKLLSSMAYATSTPRSLPTSPALSAVGGSPSLGPTISASQQAMDRKKEQRVMIVHELATEDRSLDHLEQRWTGLQEEFRPTLTKVAEFKENSQKWSLSSKFWKELDVWNYEYGSREDREKAIENAVRVYDRLRMSPSSPEWEKLLRTEERGKGKCLSRLQANLARGTAAAPIIQVQKAEDAVDSAREGTSKAESMVRTATNPAPSKAKKGSEKEAQAKRLLSNSKKPQKPAPSKGKAASKANGRVLSSEFVVDSDSDGSDDGGITNALGLSRPNPHKPARQAVPSKPRPVAKLPAKAQVTKRSREDDDDSSSSGTPLIKRFKGKAAVAAPPLQNKPRPSDSSQMSRGTSSGPSFKSKNTSPVKSSPLASSPPTNASELDQQEPEPVAAPARESKKRRAEDEKESEPTPKRQKGSSPVSQDLISKANRFKLFYEKYEALHYEITALEDPPEDKVADLLDMRQRLKKMKSAIYTEHTASVVA